jgi:RimJ/RimL family protein N-acetyltransferase
VSAGERRFDVGEWEDDALILPLLERDRRWSAYALCDLEPPYRQNACILGARDAGQPAALVLLYTLPGITGLLPFGDPDGVRAILSGTSDLPERIFYITQDHHLPVLQAAYVLESGETMSRMTVPAAELKSPPPSPLPVVRLSRDDEGAIADLYRHWGPTFFDPLMLQAGIYHGVWADGALVAVAGTHVMSTRHRVAAIGGVFTNPDYRGRGLATATTGAVAQVLAGAGIELMVLNVREDNAPAVAAYSRLGFRPWLRFTEGRASRR